MLDCSYVLSELGIVALARGVLEIVFLALHVLSCCHLCLVMHESLSVIAARLCSPYAKYQCHVP